MTKVSVITICHNEALKIRRTLESIHNQTFNDFEHIVIDGNSSDGTKEIISSFAGRLSHFVSEPDSGIYEAQNKGIKLAQGDYLIFINGGDCLHDHDVFKDIFEQDQAADIIYGNLLIEEADGSATLGRSPLKITLDFLLRGTLWHPVSFIHRSLFKKYGCYDESLKIVADYDFFLKVLMVEQANALHVDRTISRFNTDGIGSSPEYQTLHDSERAAVQRRYFTEPVIEMFEELEKYRLHNNHLQQQLCEYEEKSQPGLINRIISNLAGS